MQRKTVMTVDTTVNLGKTDIKGLSDAALDAGISRSVLISAMLKYTASKSRKRQARWGRVKYQERKPREEWERLHVRFRRDEFEFFMDLKKVLKLSVSHLIAIAIKLYLDEMLGKLAGDVDSYRYKNYAMSKIFIEDVTCWVFYWGIPTSFLEPPLHKKE